MKMIFLIHIHIDMMATTGFEAIRVGFSGMLETLNIERPVISSASLPFFSSKFCVDKLSNI